MSTHASASGIPVERIEARSYTVPTDRPESDGSFEWRSTTLVLVEASAGGARGLGYTYGDPATGRLIHASLAPLLRGWDAMSIPAAWQAMRSAVRNLGRPGLASMAIAAVDTALWDLKARLLDVPLVTLLGAVREDVPVYGSGGFTSESVPELQEELGGWASSGIGRVKLKVGRRPEEDVRRVEAARAAVGPRTELFVDANGAYARKQALAFAEAFAEHGVSWFEEPVPHEDLEGLRLLRDRAPAGMEISAGEYGYELPYFRRMLDAGAVDVLQADGTRCQGLTGLQGVGALCLAYSVPLSTHTAPMLHLHAACSLPAIRHVEYFHDHVRIERMLFDGVVAPVDGTLRPDLSRPGNGLVFKHADAERFAV